MCGRDVRRHDIAPVIAAAERDVRARKSLDRHTCSSADSNISVSLGPSDASIRAQRACT